MRRHFWSDKSLTLEEEQDPNSYGGDTFTHESPCNMVAASEHWLCAAEADSEGAQCMATHFQHGM